MLTGNFAFAPAPLLRATAITTSSDGTASMVLFPADRLRSISIKAKTFGNQKHELSQTQIENRSATVQLRPVGNLRINFGGGKRKYALTKLGLWPSYNTSDSGYSAPVIETYLDASIELNQIVTGRYKFFATCPEGFELIPDLPKEVEVLDGKFSEIDIQLVEPVGLIGRIQTTTGQDIAGARISVQYGKSRASNSCVSDSEGFFKTKVLPGRTIVHVISYGQADVKSKEHPRLSFEVPKNLSEFEIETINVEAFENK